VTRSYYSIPPEIAHRLRLIMTDVDGTLSIDGEYFSPDIVNTVMHLQGSGITVGLVSGRSLPRLKKAAILLRTNGPLVAENGGVAEIESDEQQIDLGYSREPALEAVVKLKAAFPGVIRERKDNQDRLVDVSIHSGDVTVEELRKAAPGVQIYDSGYMVHVMAVGISKGGTLMRLLERITDNPLSPDKVMVFGDSPTDVSLFQLFQNSVLIHNPKLSIEQKNAMEGSASYQSELPVEKGFIEVAEYIIKARG
jgi:hydroxymethylpyrimidine pyrophosphatase-like HAD family hydrolase